MLFFVDFVSSKKLKLCASVSLCSIKSSHQLKRRGDEPTLVHQRGELVDEESGEEAYEGIDEVMRLDIDRSATQQDVERQEDVC